MQTPTTKVLSQTADKGSIIGAIKSSNFRTREKAAYMFKKTMTLSELKRDINDLLGELQGNDALQVVHRGKAIKVIITQERYFKLLGLIDQLKEDVVVQDDLADDVPSSDRKQRLKEKLEKLADDKRSKNGIVDERGLGTS